MSVLDICKSAAEQKYAAGALSTELKNKTLTDLAAALIEDTDVILEANAKDVKRGQEGGMSQALLDRLTLTPARIEGMAEGIRQIAALPDPIGEELFGIKRPNGLLIRQRRVPMGVIGVIYEARPNVTVDVFGLCFKSGNVTIMRGGKDAFDSNKAITATIHRVLSENGLSPDLATMIEDTTHEGVNELMKLREYVDLLIPRGGAGLIRSVVENSTIPVIETGTGNCHVYVDASADIDMALDIIENAKTQRIGVCNACESLVVHKDASEALLKRMKERLDKYNVELRADADAKRILTDVSDATEDDFGREYLDYILSIKTVSSVDEAIEHINKYGTGHSETIITRDYNNGRKFQDQVDAACVYVNASTRFTDGFEFGFGAEIGISTQKLHARGPMGLTALCSTKFVIDGDGQIRG